MMTAALQSASAELYKAVEIDGCLRRSVGRGNGDGQERKRGGSNFGFGIGTP